MKNNCNFRRICTISSLRSIWIKENDKMGNDKMSKQSAPIRKRLMCFKVFK